MKDGKILANEKILLKIKKINKRPFLGNIFLEI